MPGAMRQNERRRDKSGIDDGAGIMPIRAFFISGRFSTATGFSAAADGAFEARRQARK
jgi:hypothetical protein